RLLYIFLSGLTASCLTHSFAFTAPAPTEIYPLSLHDALPIYILPWLMGEQPIRSVSAAVDRRLADRGPEEDVALCRFHFDSGFRSEEHTSELQSLRHLVCRLLLEKKKKINNTII